MTKISQLSDIGGNLAANDEFIIRDVSDASTPNKKVTASGFFNVATALGFTGLDTIVAGVTNEAKVQVFASGISGRADTTISGVIPARTTISGYFENASGTVGGTFFPVVTQTDIGTDPNQVPVCGMLGDMAFQSSAGVNIDTASVTQFSNVPLLTGGGLKFPPTQVASADPNTLDDYEEGTWTPAFNWTNVTYTTQSGYYTKIGNTVHVHGLLTWTANDPSGTTILNLPFPSTSVGDCGTCVFADVAYPAGFLVPDMTVTNVAYVRFKTSTGGLGNFSIATNDAGTFYFNIVYKVA